MIFYGTYFDGSSSRPRKVRLKVHEERVECSEHDGKTFYSASLSHCRLTPSLGNSRRFLKLPNGGRWEGDEHAIAVIEKKMAGGRGMHFVHSLEKRWRAALTSFVVLGIAVWLFVDMGIPLMAAKIAVAVPEEILDKVSKQSLTMLDERLFKPSELDSEERENMQDTFTALVKEMGLGERYRLQLRKGGKIGANAFALPSGTIIVTDELIKLAEDDRQIRGVLVHEVAHVQNRHAIRHALQQLGVFALVSISMGDITSITSVATTLPMILVESGYSRDFEREADDAVIRYFSQKSWNSKPFQEILLSLQQASGHSQQPSFLSTHPGIQERIKRLKELEAENSSTRLIF